MKKLLILLLAAIVHIHAGAQTTPYINGNGVLDTLSWSTGALDSLEIDGINAPLFIRVTDKESPEMKITIDHNLRPFIKVSQGSIVVLSMKGREGKTPWVETSHILITITTPMLTYLRNDANNTVDVTGLDNEILTIDNKLNGKITLAGTTRSLVVNNRLNGHIRAGNLIATSAIVHCETNGSIDFNALNVSIHREKNSNCKVTNLRSN